MSNGGSKKNSNSKRKTLEFEMQFSENPTPIDVWEEVYKYLEAINLIEYE